MRRLDVGRVLEAGPALALGIANAYCALVAVWLPMRVFFLLFALGCGIVAARAIAGK